MNLKELNLWLVRKARKIVYAKALLFLLLLFAFDNLNGTFDSFALANQLGWLSFTTLSMALAVTPFTKLFPKFELNATLIYARRAIGVVAFVYAFLHYTLQMHYLFGWNINTVLQLDAAAGNGFIAAYVALTILFLLTATSFDWAVRKLGKNWFNLHKLAYLAYPLIIYHAWKVGIDFQTSGNLFSISFMTVALITLVLEALRLWKTKFEKPKQSNQEM